MTEARVSVVIPVYNAAAYIGQAIASVRAQTHKPYEILVVDDGSTDDSVLIAMRAGARCIRRSHEGPGAARNSGVEQASGEYLAFLDADDLWTPDKTGRQLAALRNESVDMVFGHVQQFHEQAGSSFGPEAGCLPGTLLIRREQFLRVGLFSTEWAVGEFIDWYARAVDAGLRSSILPDVVLQRRIHDTNLGVRERASQVDYTRVVRAALHRRRNTGNAS